MDGIDVTACVATHDRADLVARCVASLEASVGEVSHETIVIDNASSDGTAERLRAGFPGITVIASATNEGYARANNRGIERARGRYVLVLNNDASVYPDTLARMVAFMDARPRVAAAICALYPHEGATEPIPCTNRYFPSARRVLFENLLTLTGLAALLRRMGLGPAVFGYSTELDREQRVEQITGAFLFVRRAAIDEVGPMDPAFFLYLEETDWCYRMRRAGWEIAYTPDARAVHLGSRSTSALADRAAIYRTSMEHYLRKHRGALSALAYRWQVRLVEKPLSPLFELARRLVPRFNR